MNPDASKRRLRLVFSLKSGLILISLVALTLGGWREHQRRHALANLVGRMTPETPGSARGGFCFVYSPNDPLEGFIKRVQELHIELLAVPRVVRALHRANAAEDSIAAFYAQRALIALEPRTALGVFAAAVERGGSEAARSEGFQGLRQLADWHPEFLPQIRAAFAHCFNDQDESFVADAVMELGAIEESADAEASRRMLVRLLDHPNAAARVAAADLLGNPGPHPQDTLACLRGHLQDKDERVCEAVRGAMERILADPSFDERAARDVEQNAAAGQGDGGA